MVALRSGRQAHLLEKDIWVVQTLSALIGTPFGADLTFKGGTSLSKIYDAIRRFSEDLDITYDIRAIAPDLVADGNVAGYIDVIPTSRSMESRWTKKIKKRLSDWVANKALPAVESNMAQAGWPARLRPEKDCIFVSYEPLCPGYGFVKPEVKVEFGAHSTGEPHEEHLCKCDAADYMPGIAFPTVQLSVMSVERTFWEKATAIHVFCRRQHNQGERLSRHWYDLVRLDDAGYADKALANYSIAQSVACHKSVFFRAKDASGNQIDYWDAVSRGGLQLVPAGMAYQVLSDDYDQMLSDGMIFDNAERFDSLMERCTDLQERANTR